jgi:hypothetical protein
VAALNVDKIPPGSDLDALVAEQAGYALIELNSSSKQFLIKSKRTSISSMLQCAASVRFDILRADIRDPLP